MLTYGSVCSGIEAASVAWHPLGWRAAWFAEVDEAASRVLAYRFPNVPNHGDMTKLPARVRAREIPAPDILVGGTPCQSFSVAGLRGGLADARGQLTIAFIDLADAIDEVRAADGLPPVIIVWENVPGVLTHHDNPLGCFLAGLAGDDDALEPGPRPEPGRSSAYWTWDKKTRHHRAKWPVAGCVAGPERAVAWRVLDAQWFGLAQRRRRVFVVASARQGFDPAAVLLEFDGVRRDSAPRRDQGESVAGATGTSADGGSRHSSHWNGGVHPPLCQSSQTRGGGIGASNQEIFEQGGAGRVPHHGGRRLRHPTVAVDLQNVSLGAEVFGTLDSEGQSRGNRGQGVLAYGGNNTSGPIDVATARNEHSGPHGRLDFESETFIVQPPVPPLWDGRDVAQTLDAVLHKGQTMPEKNRFPAVLQPIIGFPGNLSGTQCASAEDVAPRLGAKNPTAVTYGFSVKDYGGDASVGVSPTLRSMGHDSSHANGGGQVGVAYSVALRGREGGATAELGDDLAGCLQASGGGGDKPHVLASVLPFDTTQVTSPGNYSSPREGDPCHPLAAAGHPPAVCVTGTVTHTLKADGFDASEDGTGRGQPIVPSTMYSIMPMNTGRDYKARAVDVAQPPSGAGPVGGNQGGDYLLEHVHMAVRRLMPVECERLQGFPDDWTLVPGKNGKPAADGPRYKQCGNSMATTVMAWIGRRIARALAVVVDDFDTLLDDDFDRLLAA